MTRGARLARRRDPSAASTQSPLRATAVGAGAWFKVPIRIRTYPPVDLAQPGFFDVLLRSRVKAADEELRTFRAIATLTAYNAPTAEHGMFSDNVRRIWQFGMGAHID